MKAYNIIFVPPAPVEGHSGKYADIVRFQRQMSHARHCRDDILDMLAQKNPAPYFEEISFHPNERRIVIACSEDTIKAISKLSCAEVIDFIPPQKTPGHKGPKP